jgi:hypothetical protein
MSAHPIVFSIADTVFALHSDNLPSAEILEHGLKHFLSTDEPHVTIRIKNSGFPEMDLRPHDKLFDSEALWSLYIADGRIVLVITSPQTSSRPFRVAVLDPTLGQVEIFLDPPKRKPRKNRLPVFPLEHPIAQIVMEWVLAQGRGLMVHACGVNDQGRGYLFTGNSGHGKSTIARLWKNHAQILNDDRIVLRMKQGQFWMYGTPWHGDYLEISSDGVPVEKVFFLVKARKDKAVAVRGARAATMLLTRSFPPLWDEKGMAFTLDLIAGMAEKIPCYELHFQADETIVDFVRSVR